MVLSDELRGMGIYNFAGKKVGTVLYPIWRCKSKKLDGLVVLKSSFLQIKFFVPMSSIDRFEGGCIYLIKSYKTRKDGKELEHGKAIINGENAFISKYTFNEHTGEVISVEIAKSIYEDIKHKRREFTSFIVNNGKVIIES